MASDELERPPLPSSTALIAGGVALIVGYFILRSLLSTIFWLLRMGVLAAIVIGIIVLVSKVTSASGSDDA